MAIICSLVEAGRIEEAWDVAEEMTDYNHRAKAALVIARRTGDREDFENAMTLASHIDDPVLRDELEVEIRCAQQVRFDLPMSL
ncbi:MAG: hypothetical protein NTV36_03705 [Candidatus Staskawiczbacteria bacterium]|nr:hypothetical protein [Candidatus Staskawiczbacteria bacterium]